MITLNPAGSCGSRAHSVLSSANQSWRSGDVTPAVCGSAADQAEVLFPPCTRARWFGAVSVYRPGSIMCITYLKWAECVNIFIKQVFQVHLNIHSYIQQLWNKELYSEILRLLNSLLVTLSVMCLWPSFIFRLTCRPVKLKLWASTGLVS